MRRAALMNGDSEAESSSGEGEEGDGGSEDGGASEKQEEEEEEDLLADIDALSDEEAKEELREAAQQRLLEASQVG